VSSRPYNWWFLSQIIHVQILPAEAKSPWFLSTQRLKTVLRVAVFFQVRIDLWEASTTGEPTVYPMPKRIRNDQYIRSQFTFLPQHSLSQCVHVIATSWLFSVK
jgi:hypothetical protein